MKKFLLCISIGFVISLACFPQVEQSYIPLSIKYRLNPLNNFVDMPKFDAQKMLREDKKNIQAGLKRKRFAKCFDVDFHPYNSGKWEDTPAGKVWRLGIKSEGAYSIYLILKDFYLLPDVAIYVYNGNVTDFRGPFSDKDNSDKRILPIAPLPGNSVVIEINIYSNTDKFGSLVVSKILHDYKNEFGDSKLKNLYEQNSGSCNVDINCTEGNNWQIDKYAVCKLITMNGYGEICTGTMVNNLRGEDIPYLLTAQHCIGDNDIAAGTIFYFDYERPNCGSLVEKEPKIITGATLVATTDTKLDFSLLKLNKFPPVTSRAYLAGMDATESQIIGGVCIHHPQGDVKKISATASTLVTADFGENYDVNSHWLVEKWDVGTTEQGSSGSPFFNNNRMVVGTLSGGDADCSNSVNDYYSKLNLAWDYYPQPENQLKYWIDPDNTGYRIVPARDPFGFTNANCDTIWNTDSTDIMEISNQNLTWGYLSGNNSEGFTQFAEKFTFSDSIEVPGIFLKVGKNYKGNTFNYITLKVWGGTDTPQNVIYTQPVYLKNLQTEVLNAIELDSLLVLKGDCFIGYSLTYNTPADTFAVFHARSRSNSVSTMYVFKDSWENITNVTDPNYYSSLEIGVFAFKNLRFKLNIPPTVTVKNKFNIYPNPSSGYLYIDIPEKDEFKEVVYFDLAGKKIHLPYEVFNDKIRLNLAGLRDGIYGVTLICKNTRYSAKIIILNNK